MISLTKIWEYGRQRWANWRRQPTKPEPAPASSEPFVAPVFTRAANDAGSLVQEFLAVGRYALLLRPQIIENLEDDQIRKTIDALDAQMALSPVGDVVLGQPIEDCDDFDTDGTAVATVQSRVVHVESIFLDRYAVTNCQYKHFVDGGGYEEMGIWEEDVWAAMLDFVDQTGHPGPHYWHNGTFPRGQADHPVVGVSWYEATAYARWCGKRLPRDAEWTKAACWPVTISPGNLQQRKFPWGEIMENDRANLWSAGINSTVPTDEFEKGISVGGLLQMVGNVWEWMSGPYGTPDDVSLALPVPMKSIRGGAFDTYFDNQATCHFQSGENPLHRKHNIGFRLVLGICDLAPRAAELIYGGSTEPITVATEV